MKTKKFHSIVNNTSEEIQEHVKMSMDILDRIHELLDEKFEGKQKLLAEKMQKTEAEVSKWLSGVQNFTIRTLTKLEIAFGAPIIAVCTKSTNSTFVQARAYRQDHVKVAVDGNGKLKEKHIYTNIQKPNFNKTQVKHSLPA